MLGGRIIVLDGSQRWVRQHPNGLGLERPSHPAKPKVILLTTGSVLAASKTMTARRTKTATTAPRAGRADIGPGDAHAADGGGHIPGRSARQWAGSCAASPASRAMPSGPYPGRGLPPGGGPGPSASAAMISLKASWVIVPRRRDRDSPGTDLSRILTITQALKIISAYTSEDMFEILTSSETLIDHPAHTATHGQ